MIARLLPAFSTGFALAYGYAASAHLQFFVYYPALGEFSTATKPLADAGPPMLWYAWLAFAVGGGILAMLLAFALPRRLAGLWAALSWSTVFGVALVQVYLARAWFQQ